MTTYVSIIRYACTTGWPTCRCVAWTAMVLHDAPEPQMNARGFRCPCCGNVCRERDIRTERAADLAAIAASAGA